MWVPTEDDAVEMFARHFEALHRSGAAAKAKQKAFELRDRGDRTGYAVWKKVADRIEQLRRPDHVDQRRESEAA